MSQAKKYNRVLIKLSGEALSGDMNSGILDSKALFSLANIIYDIVNSGVKVAVVIGAGNICRGSLISQNKEIDRVTGDKMGMLGTVINSFAFCSYLKSLNLKSIVLTAVKMDDFAEEYSPEVANHYLDEGYVVVFGGGTGKPFFTTDTCATLRAIEIKADAILMGKNGVDGIYSADPRIDKDAKLYAKISCSDIIKRDLKVMDISAVKMLKDKDIDVRVFNMANPSNFKKVIDGEDIGTTITKG